MGFLSSLSGSKSVTTPATGYYNLPPWLKSQINTLGQAIPGATTPDAFTLPDYNSDQLSAFNIARNQANPTSDSIMNLVNTFMNPYTDSVISEINRQSQGDNSILQQNLSSAGQLGSNRQYLGANDIDLSRQNQIGTFLSNQFNNALNTGLNQQQQGFSNLLGIGNQQQSQDFTNQQAPYNALVAQQGLLNPLVSLFAGSRPSTTVKSGGGLGGFLGGVNNLISAGSNLYSNLGGFFG